MRPTYHLPFWKTAPIIRLLIPLIAGIILHWYVQFTLTFILVSLASFLTAFLLTHFFSAPSAYLFRKFQAFLFYIFIAAVGMLLTWHKDSRHQPDWYGRSYADSSVLLIKINEPLTAKERSFKTEGTIIRVINGRQETNSSGKILLYFSKDSITPPIQYGDLILVGQPLQPIRNSGNPGAFNYQRYAAFQQLYHQLFLKPGDWQATGLSNPHFFRSFLFDARASVLGTLQRYIDNDAGELGIAEALLIGFKEDLDKDLVQAYSNTGVVHIIAISGLHLGLIFFVLTWLFNRTPVLKRSRHVKVLLLITCLWLFSLLTGGAASVLRSAVMFTVIILGKYYFKQSSVYNSLAASAFLMLCYNPYYLWDVGFQLSYLAVIGIVSLQGPIYRAWYIKNKMLRKTWEMASITIAAQVAAFPICIYYFHQFPNLFLFTNLLVVPLSTIILFGEILLIICASLSPVANFLGVVLTALIWFMNKAILFFNGFSFSVWDNIYATMFTTWLLYGLVIFFCSWLLKRQRKLLRLAVACLAGLSVMFTYAYSQLRQQKKIIIYNVSKHRAVDFISANKNVFEGDSVLKSEGLLQNFHLKPARISMQVSKSAEQMPWLKSSGVIRQFYNKKMVFIDTNYTLHPSDSIVAIDVLLISNNAAVELRDLLEVVKPSVVVLDASNSLWKIEKWKKECEQLLLRCHSVAEQGAFVLNVQE